MPDETVGALFHQMRRQVRRGDGRKRMLGTCLDGPPEQSERTQVEKRAGSPTLRSDARCYQNGDKMVDRKRYSARLCHLHPGGHSGWLAEELSHCPTEAGKTTK